MRHKEIRLENLTRREFREALDSGHFSLAIVATGSIEQHLEHLTFPQDIANSTYIAEQVAGELYPDAVVAVPMSIGISEHHMLFAGTMTAKPGSWLAVLFDAVESLVRHGIKKVLILNGHGGNVEPVKSVIQQWQLHLTKSYGSPLSSADLDGITSHDRYVETLLERSDAGVDLRFLNYWDAIPESWVEDVLDTGTFPGHAQEFETSLAMYADPERVRPDAIAHNQDRGPAAATAEKGRILMEKAIEGVTEVVQGMLSR